MRQDGNDRNLNGISRVGTRESIPLQKRLFSVEEAAEYLSLSPWTIREMGTHGRLPVVRLGRRVLFDREDLDQWIELSKIRIET